MVGFFKIVGYSKFLKCHFCIFLTILERGLMLEQVNHLLKDFRFEYQMYLYIHHIWHEYEVDYVRIVENTFLL